MAREPNKDTSRLPKWAQEQLESNTREIANLRDRIAELSNGHPGSNVAIDGHHVYPDMTLPNNSGVLIYLGTDRDRWKNTVEIQPREKGGKMGIEIRGADKGIRIVPSSYNSVRVSLDD